MAMGIKCGAHVHRSIVPLEVHHVWPLGDGGPNAVSNKVVVCSNGHSAIHDLLDKMRKGPVSWTVRMHYGWRIRKLAKQGYDAIQNAKGGRRNG
jgi:hypothetical protein